MKWSLSEFLNLIELRSQTWCYVGLGETGGFSIPPGDFTLGGGKVAAHLLCSRLRVRWPGGQQPGLIPPVLRCRAKGLINLEALVQRTAGPGSSAVLTSFAHLLFADAFRTHPDCQAVFRESNLHDPISRALQFIETHPFQHWTLEVLARKVGMSRANFAVRFVEKMGRTPFDVLTGERMGHAAEFIRNTDLKISEIGEKIGYRSESAFSRRFTIHFGIPPGSMRTQSRAAAQ